GREGAPGRRTLGRAEQHDRVDCVARADAQGWAGRARRAGGACGADLRAGVTMDSDDDLTMEEAERRLADAVQRGDRAAEADVRSRKAYMHLTRGQQDTAVAEMQAARDIHAQAGDQAGLMRTEYGLGLLLSRAAETGTAAIDAFMRAARLARSLGDQVQQM